MKKVLQTIAWALIVVILLGVIGGSVWLAYRTDWFRDFSVFQSKEDPEDNGVKDENGEDLGGENSSDPVELPSKMAFTRAAQAGTSAGTITVEAVFEPRETTNKDVDWTVSFKDAGSGWAQGKSVEDYVTATPLGDGATTATVRCLQPFGEQIVVKVTSRDRKELTAECVLDFLQKPTNVQVKIGDIDVVLGGDTEISVDITTSSAGDGGAVSVTYDLTEVYTVAANYKKVITLTHDEGLSGNYVAYDQNLGSSSSKVTYDQPDNMDGKDLYFDLRLFSEYHFVYKSTGFSTGQMQETSENWAEAGSEMLQSYFQSYQNRIFWTMTVKLVQDVDDEEEVAFEYTSELRWTGITGVYLSLDPDHHTFHDTDAEE